MFYNDVGFKDSLDKTRHIMDEKHINIVQFNVHGMQGEIHYCPLYQSA